MEALATRFIESLERGEADASALDTSGAPSPERAALAFRKAAQHPDLAEAIPLWAPACLASARPEYAAHALVEIADRCRASGRLRFDPARHPLLPRVLGCSGFLARLLLRHPEWLVELEGPMPDAPAGDPVAADWNAIRSAKYRGLLRVAARDLAGRSFADSSRELSDLADRCLSAALDCASLETNIATPVLFALGKLGGRELNFSSDVDLLFLHDTPDGSDALEYNHAVQASIRHLKARLEQPTEDGFGYRVDLDLRPEGPTGVLANSVEAALAYYETWGAEWERQMLIRLRHVAGPPATAASFSEGITPFVYRRLIDPGAMQSVRDMKSRIEDERRRAGRDLETDLKEGPGGIRDVEFLVQSFQLFFGGQHPSLRSGNVLVTLDALAELELLPPNTVPALSECYAWLRRAEHALQLAEEQQIHRFPRDPAEQLGLARRMGYRDAEGKRARERLLDDWTRVRNEVRAHFEALVFGGTP